MKNKNKKSKKLLLKYAKSKLFVKEKVRFKIKKSKKVLILNSNPNEPKHLCPRLKSYFYERHFSL